MKRITVSQAVGRELESRHPLGNSSLPAISSEGFFAIFDVCGPICRFFLLENTEKYHVDFVDICGFFFFGKNNISSSGVINTSNFTSRYLKPLLSKIGAHESFKYHDLRHTYAALLLKGIPVKAVSERLEHSTVVITQCTYAHVLPEMQAEVVKVLVGVFTKTGQ